MQAVFSLLTSLKLVLPKHLVGVELDDLRAEAGYPKDVFTKAFITKTLKMAGNVGAAKTGTSSSVPMGSSPLAQPYSPMMNLLGGESAMRVAAAMSRGDKPVDMDSKLKASMFGKLPWHLVVDAQVWQLLSAETTTAAASIPKRVPFCYVDLAAKEMLPMWMAPEAVGGKAHLPGDNDVLADGAGSSNTPMAALGAALEGMSGNPRFFRSLDQWVAAWWRYAVPAICLGHLTWPAVLGHVNTIMRLAEECKTEGGGASTYLPVLHDDLLRRNLAKRAEQRDPDLDIELTMQKPDKAVLEAARTRLSSVMQVAGLRGHTNWDHARPAPPSGSGAQESALAKQQAAALATQRQAEAATRMLQKQQIEMEAKAIAVSQGNQQRVGGFGGKGHGQGTKGGGKKRNAEGEGLSNRAMHIDVVCAMAMRLFHLAVEASTPQTHSKTCWEFIPKDGEFL